VRERGSERGVFVIESGKARFVVVDQSETEGDKVRVTRGLRGGETLVLEPPASLQDGASVQVDAQSP
jgi:hypothetical protein